VAPFSVTARTRWHRPLICASVPPTERGYFTDNISLRRRRGSRQGIRFFFTACLGRLHSRFCFRLRLLFDFDGRLHNGRSFHLVVLLGFSPCAGTGSPDSPRTHFIIENPFDLFFLRRAPPKVDTFYREPGGVFPFQGEQLFGRPAQITDVPLFSFGSSFGFFLVPPRTPPGILYLPYFLWFRDFRPVRSAFFKKSKLPFRSRLVCENYVLLYYWLKTHFLSGMFSGFIERPVSSYGLPLPNPF